MTTSGALVELRVLDGPNLYFPRAAIKLTLDVRALLDLDDDAARTLARQIGVVNARPGDAGSGQRQRFAARAVARLVRRIATEAGTTRLAVRSRPTADVHQLVVAYPWRHRDKAEAQALAVAGVLDALPRLVAGQAGGDPGVALASVLADAADRVRLAPNGGSPTAVRPRIPVVAVTGTNGKTTTSRMIAHMGRRAGLVVGWSSTDGVYVDGELVEAGDYSGPSGAQRVLADRRVRLAVTETARGGILLRGMGITANDVSVVTNVSADHLGLQGIDTLDQLAEVKAVITKVTKATGWVVVNGDDPRTFAMRLGSPARPFVFSRDPGSPTLRAALDEGGRAATVLDGDLVVLDAGGDPTHLTPVADIPMTLAGLSHFNVENALAAAAAGLAIGLAPAAVIEGLRDFQPDPTDNPGRMNIYSVKDVTVVIDLAHNEAGLAALLEVMAGLRSPGARLGLGLGTAGDRTDEIITILGEIGARGADRAVIVHKDAYLRGRATEDMDALYRAGAAAVGVHDVPSYASELAGLEVLLAEAAPGDVVALMCHQNRVEVDAWLRSQGGTVDDAETIRAKVIAAREGTQMIIAATLVDRPDLAERGIDSGTVWPEYNRHGDVVNQWWRYLWDELPDLQLVLYDEETDEVVAEGHTGAFAWDGRDETLPGSFDELIERVITTRRAAEPVNTLTALAAEVPPAGRQRGLAAEILAAMRALAVRRGLTHLVAPVRPSWKDRYPLAPIESYVTWRRDDGELLDPWMRLHERLGARIGPALPRSLHITGTVAEWSSWTGLAFPVSGSYVFPEGLAPVEIDVEADRGAYWEPNVWMIHPDC